MIDEAGQFSLANTIAVARAARNLLLLGDPQQLPQVSQGTPPRAGRHSALGWLAAGHGALPAEFGYFLDRTLAHAPRAVRAGVGTGLRGPAAGHRARAPPRAPRRRRPGVRTLVVDHVGNSTESPEEAARSCVIGADCCARRGPTRGETRPLAQRDLLVVAPYNAQVELIRATLDGAGLREIAVGTVDRFQGRQAAVVVVSMTASSAAEVPRGMSFLLSRNRLNVAISRGQWQAVIVRSRLLTDYLPGTPAAPRPMLGAFMRLCQ